MALEISFKIDIDMISNTLTDEGKIGAGDREGEREREREREHTCTTDIREYEPKSGGETPVERCPSMIGAKGQPGIKWHSFPGAIPSSTTDRKTSTADISDDKRVSILVLFQFSLSLQ